MAREKDISYDPEQNEAIRRQRASRKFESLADRLVNALETTPVNWGDPEEVDEEATALDYRQRAAKEMKKMLRQAES